MRRWRFAWAWTIGAVLAAAPAAAQVLTPVGGAGPHGHTHEAGQVDDGGAAATFALFAGGIGPASFRAIVEADISDFGTYLDQTALDAHQDNPDAHHAEDHAASHALGGADALTVTTLASACTDAQVLGGTAAGTGVECQADADTAAGKTFTGLDTTIVTGTPGAAGNCAEWDINGDAVDSGAACGGGGGIGGSTGATDNALLRADGVGGATLQASPATVTDAGAVVVPTGGSGAAPRLAFGADGNTGFYEYAADSVVFGTGGTERWISNSAWIVGSWTGASPALRNTLTGANILPRASDGDSGLGWNANDDIFLFAGGVGIRQTNTATTLDVAQVNVPFAQTCTDSSDANPGALTIAVSGATNVRIVSADPHGCDLVVSETGASDGQLLELELTSSAGGVITLPDTPGAQNLAGAWAPGAGDSLTLRYNLTASEWRERARADI